MEDIVKKILEKENIPYAEIVKSEAGFTNEVYFIDDKSVIKVISKEKSYKLHNEIEFYLNVKSESIPGYIASGKIDDTLYLIIEKVKGQTLYNLWHIMTEEEREETIKKLVKILKDINESDYEFLSEKYKSVNWTAKMRKTCEININELKARGLDAEFLETFMEKEIDSLFSQQKIKLIYNDAHFDNFILNDDKLYIIDFDRIFAGSLDYELLIIDSMIDSPMKFASLEEEKFVVDSHYAHIREYLKKYYPELYSFDRIDDRLVVYKFFYNLSECFEYNDMERLKQICKNFRQHFRI